MEMPPCYKRGSEANRRLCATVVTRRPRVLLWSFKREIWVLCYGISRFCLVTAWSRAGNWHKE
jgi:hypothetical protein